MDWLITKSVPWNDLIFLELILNVSFNSQPKMLAVKNEDGRKRGELTET